MMTELYFWGDVIYLPLGYLFMSILNIVNGDDNTKKLVLTDSSNNIFNGLYLEKPARSLEKKRVFSFAYHARHKASRNM